jgi:hypothetical protein
LLRDWFCATVADEMKRRRQRFRAVFGALALLIGALFSPVVFATQPESNICAMACCVEVGHCCCKPSKPAVAGQHRDDETTLSQAELAAPCPEGCTTSSFQSNLSQREAIRPAIHPLTLLCSVTTHAPPLTQRLSAVALTCLSPRAPPLQIAIA